MTNQTPRPTVQDVNPKLAAHDSLAHAIKDLQDLVFNIALPKIKKAKMVKVPANTALALQSSSVHICML